MIVIPNKNFTADSIHLVQLLNSTMKVNMLKACDKLDLYVSPNLKKDETAKRIAQDMLDNPIEILSRLNKQELQIVDEFVKVMPTPVSFAICARPSTSLRNYIWLPPIVMRQTRNGICSCRMNCVKLCQAAISSISTWQRKVRKDQQLSSSA